MFFRFIAFLSGRQAACVFAKTESNIAANVTATSKYPTERSARSFVKNRAGATRNPYTPSAIFAQRIGIRRFSAWSTDFPDGTSAPASGLARQFE